MFETAAAGRNLVDMLLELHKGRSSGVLRFERGSAKKQLIIFEGGLANAESNVKEEHLAVLLVQMNRFPRSEIPRVTALMKQGKTTDEALLETHKIDQSVLNEGALEQAVVILASLFAWNECEVRFYEGESRGRRLVNLAFPLPALLVLASRRAAQCRFLPPALTKLEGMVAQAGSEAGSRLDLPLDNLEGMVYSLARERMPVEQLLSLIPAGSKRPDELLLGLLLLGLLRLAAPSPAAAPDDSQKEETAGARMLRERVEDLLSKFEACDHYEILSVPTDATEEQIKNAYHGLAREFHPDRFQSEEYSKDLRTRVEKLFTYITGAYTTLSDPASRARHDEDRFKKGSKVDAAHEARTGVSRETEEMTEALYNAARNKISKGEHEEAITLLKECVWSRPKEPRFLYYLGVAKAEIKKYRKEAEQHLLKALELDPLKLECHLELGKLYIKENLPRRAEAQLLEVLRWDARHAEAIKLMATLSKKK